MTFWKIFRFELAYQARRVPTWLYFAAMVFFASVQMLGNYPQAARSGGFFLGAPFVVADVTGIVCMIWLLVGAFVAGDAAARDVSTGMHPLTYTAPVRKAHYLGGRFLAAFILNALILLAVPVGILLGIHAPEIEPEIRGPFMPAAYLTAYAFIALPNAFVASAIQFSFAALSRRATVSYLVGVLLLVGAASGAVVAEDLGLWELGKLMDPIGIVLVTEVSRGWTAIEQNSQLIALEGSLLANRLLWLGIALGTLAFTHFRFRFSHPTESTWWRHVTRRRDVHALAPGGPVTARSTPVSVPRVRRTLGLRAHARQTLTIAWTSFGSIAKSRTGVLLLALVGLFGLASVDPAFMGVPLLPRTDYVLRGLTIDPGAPPLFLIIPLLIVFWSGELVWRERGAGLSEIIDAAPVPDWVLFLGTFLGLGLVLALCMALRMAAGMFAQTLMGHYDFEIGLYLQVLFGIQLASYLLLALLALAVQVLANHRHVGHLVTLLVFVLMVVASQRTIGHELLSPGSGPEWSYTDMSGFGASLKPWLWFKLYWAAWALLLAVGVRLLWVRGRDGGLGMRLRMARRRFTAATAATAAAAGALILVTGGFIFYNTNVLNAYETASDRMELRAEYERRYGQSRGIPQPRLTSTDLRVEIYPGQRAADIEGTYHLVNRSAVPIDTVHLAVEVEPRVVEFDRPARRVTEDQELGHRIYALEEPLQPGDSLRLDFEMRIASRGFRRNGVEATVVPNGTYFTNLDWLPAIGYQPIRELRSAGERRAHGLPLRPAIPSLYDVEARQNAAGAERIAFEAVVGTEEGQTAIAPGALVRSWTDGGRRYFHYATDAPIGNEYAFFSADYEVREGRWNDVAIEVFHHPGHTENLDRMVRSVQASLTYYTEQFGPYPWGYIRLIERPGHGFGMHAEATTIDYEEGSSLVNPADGPRVLDLPFYVVAHEVAHQWWGSQLSLSRPLEGNGLLVESLASYSAYQVVEQTYGAEHLRRILRQLRVAYRVPRARAGVPLLRANDAFQSYRKGPFAMYALSKYLGEKRVNEALRRMLEDHRSGMPPVLTSLDLHRNLQAVTPDSLQSLLHDFFEANTYWELETEWATAEQTEAGTWQVTLEVRARKVVVDTMGGETPRPMDDWVQIGVFAPAEEGQESGEPLYLQMHRIRSNARSITVTVPRTPARAGIDPYYLLMDWDVSDNVEEVRIAGSGGG